MSQLQQTFLQARAEADRYEAVIRAQVALYQFIVSYGKMLTQLQSSLTAVRVALDAPADVREQASEVIGFQIRVDDKCGLGTAAWAEDEHEW